MSSDVLSVRRLNRATLDRQGLLQRRIGGPADVIGHLAGLQAQHANQPYIALWSRMADLTRADLQGALERRSVVRATVMRSTLHLVASADFTVYDSAAGASRMAVWAPTARKAGFDHAALHRALLDYCDEPRSIEEMETHLETVLDGQAVAKHVPAGVRRAVFRIASAGGGLVHVPPSGFWGEHGKNRYVAAAAWLGDRGAPIDPDTARETAVLRYLGAYGPASTADIQQWLGQARIGVIRSTIESLGNRLRSYRGDDGRDLLDLADATAAREDAAAPPRFLSRWDSVLISYDVRDRILPKTIRAAVVKKNGDFLPTFLIDGFVAGLWSASNAKGAATIELAPFGKVPAADRKALEAEADRLLHFIDPDATAHDVRWAGVAT